MTILDSVTLKAEISQHVWYLHHPQSVISQDILQELRLYTTHWKHLQITIELLERSVLFLKWNGNVTVKYWGSLIELQWFFIRRLQWTKQEQRNRRCSHDLTSDCRRPEMTSSNSWLDLKSAGRKWKWVWTGTSLTSQGSFFGFVCVFLFCFQGKQSVFWLLLFFDVFFFFSLQCFFRCRHRRDAAGPADSLPGPRLFTFRRGEAFWVSKKMKKKKNWRP